MHHFYRRDEVVMLLQALFCFSVGVMLAAYIAMSIE